MAAMTVGIAQSSDEVVSTITGLGYKDTTDFGGLSHLSIAGGAPIMLSGLNFASSASSNAWIFSPIWVDGAEVWGPAMDSDDSMNSNDLAGRLAIVAPPADQLMSTTMDQFNGEFLPTGYPHNDILRFEVKI